MITAFFGLVGAKVGCSYPCGIRQNQDITRNGALFALPRRTCHEDHQRPVSEHSPCSILFGTGRFILNKQVYHENHNICAAISETSPESTDRNCGGGLERTSKDAHHAPSQQLRWIRSHVPRECRKEARCSQVERIKA